MIRLSARAAILLPILLVTSGLLTSCGHDREPPAPPTDVAVVPGDQSMTVTWTMAPDVEYWLYYAPRSSISVDDWMGAGSKVLLNAKSPQLLTGLTNGQIYSVTIDGRYNGGPGGAGSASVSATPRLAGATWTPGAQATGPGDLRGIAFGSTFVAAGIGGAMYSSADGKTWTLLVSNTASDLNAVVYGGIYVAAGATGTIVTSSDAVTWTATTVGNAINALAANGAGYYVAVGAPGGAMYSSGGVTWTAVSTAITNPLYGVAYGAGLYVAVGANGTIVTSADGGINWTAQTSPTLSALTAIAWGYDTTVTPNVGRFVAVGAGGTVITSTDGATWVAATTPPPAATTLNAVTYGHQFIAVGNGGAVFTSTDGINWQSQTSGTGSNLYAITHNTSGVYGYAAVGAAGTNLTAY